MRDKIAEHDILSDPELLERIVLSLRYRYGKNYFEVREWFQRQYNWGSDFFEEQMMRLDSIGGMAS